MVRLSYSVLFSFSQAASASSLLPNRTVPKPLLCLVRVRAAAAAGGEKCAGRQWQQGTARWMNHRRTRGSRAEAQKQLLAARDTQRVLLLLLLLLLQEPHSASAFLLPRCCCLVSDPAAQQARHKPLYLPSTPQLPCLSTAWLTVCPPPTLLLQLSDSQPASPSACPDQITQQLTPTASTPPTHTRAPALAPGVIHHVCPLHLPVLEQVLQLLPRGAPGQVVDNHLQTAHDTAHATARGRDSKARAGAAGSISQLTAGCTLQRGPSLLPEMDPRRSTPSGQLLAEPNTGCCRPLRAALMPMLH